MWMSINKSADISLIRQVYEQIKSMILEEKLLAGDKLPSTRWLSNDLNISRNVILEAYAQLMVEGYTESKKGFGTIVSKGICLKKNQLKVEMQPKKIRPANDCNIIDFRSGIPDLKMFPKEEWARLLNRICKDMHPSDFRYCGAEGRIELRQALSKYLLNVRGITCTPEQIMIISGSTQGLSLISKLLYSEGKEVIIEDPVHYGLLNVISSCGYSINPVPVDNKGIRTDMIKAGDNLGFMYVTPSHQFPLGGVLPIQRRVELIEFAEKRDCYIVEDDYDSEFRYNGQPISSLYELNPNRVIYIGSFSKILAPALRLGYMLLPESLISAYVSLKIHADVHTETISQLALAQFIEHRKLEKHIWKMKKEYCKKRQALINSLKSNFQDEFIIEGEAAGLHLVIEFKNVSFTKEILSKILKEKVKVYPVEKYAIHKGNHMNKIILGYGHLSIEEIQEGVKRIRKGIISSDQ